MRNRLLWLALGWPTRDVLERHAGKAVRRYLLALFGMPVINVTMVFAVTYAALLWVPADFTLVFIVAATFLLGGVPQQLTNIRKSHEYNIIRARHAAPDSVYDDILATLSQQGGFAPPLVLRIPSEDFNVLIIPLRQRSIILLAGDFSEVTRSDIRGILAHESSHMIIPFGNTMMDVVTCILSSLDDLLTLCIRSLNKEKRGTLKPGVLFSSLRYHVLSFLTMILSLTHTDTISRQRELACDAVGAMLCRDPLPLMCALYKFGKGYISSTHPETGKRIVSLLQLSDAQRDTR